VIFAALSGLLFFFGLRMTGLAIVVLSLLESPAPKPEWSDETEMN
jgi:hypothetical protein